jgi:hypothetical protein
VFFVTRYVWVSGIAPTEKCFEDTNKVIRENQIVIGKSVTRDLHMLAYLFYVIRKILALEIVPTPEAMYLFAP